MTRSTATLFPAAPAPAPALTPAPVVPATVRAPMDGAAALRFFLTAYAGGLVFFLAILL